MIAATGIALTSSAPGAALVALVLVGLTLPVARGVARRDGDARLSGLIMCALVLHLLGSLAQIFIVDHVYGGIADFLRYDHQGALLSANFRRGNFSTAGSGVTSVLGDGSVSIIAGIVFAVVGVDQAAGFFVFSWMALMGLVLFYRAFAVGFPDGDRRRYALLVFLLPSLLYWPSVVGKEAVMMLALGIAALGGARVLARARGGLGLLLVGLAIGAAVRPQEALLFFGAFFVAYLLRRRQPAGALAPLRGAGRLVLLLGAGAALLLLTEKLLGSAHLAGSSLTGVLSKVHANNTGTGAGFGSSDVAYSPNPLYFPRDLYTVVLDPLPVQAHSATQLAASLENTVILALVLTSLRRLGQALRASFHRPYVMAAVIYSAGFAYVFAALGNLGLIDRERALLFPFLLVLFAVPLSPRGAEESYPWEHGAPRRAGRAAGEASAADLLA